MAYFSLHDLLGELDLDENASERDIRRAYAIKLKQIDPETDPTGFQTLHETYQLLLDWSRARDRAADAEPEAEAGGEDFEFNPAEVAFTVEMPLQPDIEVPPPQSTESQAITDAENLFAAMGPKFGAILNLKSDRMVAEACKILRATLQDPALISIDAKDYFEWCVARHLVQGWRPGNEALFEAAIAEFNWVEEPKRLMRFAQVGRMLNAAVDERFAFNRQHPQERRAQLNVLRRLRSNEEPDHRVLIHQMKRADLIALRYPHLFALVSNEANLTHWRSANEKVPKWRRMLTITAPVETGNAPKERKRGLFKFWAWAFVGILVFTVIGNSMKPSVPYRGPSSSNSPLGQAAKRYEPPAMPVSKPSAADIRKKYSGAATLGGCRDAYTLGVQFRFDNVFPIIQPDPVYDRYVSKCLIAKFWPSTPQASRIASAATARNMTAAQQALQKLALPPPAQKSRDEPKRNSATMLREPLVDPGKEWFDVSPSKSEGNGR